MEAKGTIRRQNEVFSRGFVKSAVTNAVYLLCGILVSRGAVLGSLAPFGASYASAVPKKYLFPSLVGTAFGYILLSPSDSFRYIAVVIAIGGIRWLMSDLPKIRDSRLFAPLTAFIPIFATGIALTFVSTSTLTTFADCVIEAVISGAAAYFISSAVRLSGEKRSISSYSQQETASLVMTGCIIILAFGSVAFENVSLGRIMAVIAVLLCARYGGVTGGAVSGISTGAVFSIASRSLGYLCGGYSFGGLMAGLFAPLGKLGCAIAFAISSSVMSLAFGDTNAVAGVFIESVVGGAVFMLLPKEVGNIITPVFESDRSATLGETLRKNIIMRLNFASKAIANVKNDVNSVSDKLTELYSPTFDWVCENVEKEVCSLCGLKMYCHENQQGETRDDFYRLEEILEAQGEVYENDVEEVFVKNCCKKREIAKSMTDNYREFLSCMEAQRRAADVRGVVAGQFSGLSDILCDLSREFESALRCDSESASRIISALSEQGAVVEECVCLVGKNGRMSVELIMKGGRCKKLSKGFIMREVSRACGRRFDLPTISDEGGRQRLALCEMPYYDVEIGTDQHIANNGKLCGDCLNYFNDGFGKTYAIVCDGMGTGGRAAVDGNMAASVMTRLLRAGLSPESSLAIVNSALMVKSEDESLSTLDLVSVDLYTGKVTLRKAGAPQTYIKKGGRVMTREMPSLPAGILNGISFSADSVNLSTGDMAVMVSDGVLTGDDKWLESLIKGWNNGSAQDLARAVVDEAMKRRNDSREDDITAVVIRITENE